MKIETAAKREQKIKELSRRITGLCVAFYDKATEEQKAELMRLLDQLEAAMIAYRQHEMAWDGQLIDVTIKIGDTKVKTHDFSTWDSVMDKARDVFIFVAQN
jgi:hypothetical protein